MFFLRVNDVLIPCLAVGVLVRPLESSDVTQTKIRVLQFLSRINDGEHLGEINRGAFII